MVTRTALILTVGPLLLFAACGEADPPAESIPESTIVAPPPTTTTTSTPPATTAPTSAPTTTTTVPPPVVETSGSLPVASAFLVYGMDGIVAVSGSGDLTRLTDDPTAVAYAFGDSLVVSQGVSGVGSIPPIGDGPVVIRSTQGTQMYAGDADEKLRLFDVAVVDGRPVAAITATTGYGPDDAEDRLLLVDILTLERSDLGMVGGWEAGVVQAQIAGNTIVTLTAVSVDRHLEARSLTGELLWSIENVIEPDTSATLLATESAVLLLDPRFDEDFTPSLNLTQYELATGAVVATHSVTLDASFDGGFCNTADWDGDVVLCSESYGGPFSVDLASGAVTPLTSRDEGNASHTLSVAEWRVEASQSAEDALRDGIVPELAALSFDMRVTQYPEYFGPTRIETPEGIWQISVPAMEIPGLENLCLLGDRDGLYGRDFICTFEYGEILLLDSTTNEILHAYPFPGIDPHALLVTDEAVYCIRQGDGAFPDSMLCRIDRATLDATVRVFRWETDSAFGPESDQYIPENWTITDPVDFVVWEAMSVSDGDIVITGWSGTARIDPLTLELREVKTGG